MFRASASGFAPVSTTPLNHQAAPPLDRSDGIDRLGLIGAMLLVLAVRALILGIGLLSIHLAPETVKPMNREHPWIAWDAQHYFRIAAEGYPQTKTGQPYRDVTTFMLIAYFPAVPLVARALAEVLPIGFTLVSFSNLCSLAGFIFCYDWARRLAGRRAATICVLLIAVFPGAVSFAAGMTEGPFFLLVSLALWLLERQRYWPAAIAAGIATAMRPTGVALAMLVPLMLLINQGLKPTGRRIIVLILIGLVSGSGLLAYEGFLWNRYKTPTAYFESQKNWDQMDQSRLQREAASGVRRYSWEFFKERMGRPQSWNRLFALVVTLAILAALIKPPIAVLRVLMLMPLMIFLMTALPGGGLRISSLTRYLAPAAPLFLACALWLCAGRRTAWTLALLVALLAVQMYYAWLFPREIWVG
jgi:Gpi18-like mannosyltransferase